MLYLTLFILSLFVPLQIIAFQSNDAYNAHELFHSVLLTSKENVTYTNNENDLLSFRSYGQRVAKSASAAAMIDVVLVRWYCSISLIALSVLSLLLLKLSLFYWNSYNFSRKVMMFAWFASFVLPFAIATIPTRCFVRWDQFETQSNIFMKGVAIHYELDYKETQVVSSCTM